MAKIKLLSRDEKAFFISVKAAAHCGVFANALGLDDEGEETKESYEPVPIDRVSSAALEKVVEYLIHYADEKQIDIKEPISGTFEGNVGQPWYRDFIGSMDMETFYAVRVAAEYLDLPQLFSLATIWLTFELMKKDLDGIHELLNIPKPTEQEVQEARREHPWLFTGEHASPEEVNEDCDEGKADPADDEDSDE